MSKKFKNSKRERRNRLFTPVFRLMVGGALLIAAVSCLV